MPGLVTVSVSVAWPPGSTLRRVGSSRRIGSVTAYPFCAVLSDAPVDRTSVVTQGAVRRADRRAVQGRLPDRAAGRCSQGWSGSRCADPESGRRQTPCVIHEVDSALLALIEREATGTRDVEVVFDAPTKDWAGRRNAPTIDVYLYDIREDLRRRERGLLNEYDDGSGSPPATCRRGTSSCRTSSPPGPSDPRTSTACSPSLLSCFLRHEALPEDLLTGPLAELGLPVPVTIALPPPEDRSFADVWSALGGELKPSLDVVVSAPTWTGRRLSRPRPLTSDAAARSRWAASTRTGRRARCHAAPSTVDSRRDAPPRPPPRKARKRSR